ncbi:RNA-binding protein [filamentous cyanobacterium CCP5]|nr:RNA-binding protein [filamentous cyanobacterium CCP5]
MGQSSSSANLLVDGYNVIGAWHVLQRTHQQGGLEAARQALIEALVGYSTYRGYETRVVFDAYGQNSPSAQEQITPSLSVQFTDFGQTADSYIERFCALFRQQPSARRKRLLVATSDRVQQQTVTGYGAEWISALQLEADVRFANTGIRRRQRGRMQSNSRYLMNTLDQEVKDKLMQLRFGLK